jgi:hypothetical protein
MTKSAASQASRTIGFDANSSVEYPFSVSARFVGSATNPSGANPALAASIMSDASRRAIASAMGLRHELPMQMNKTRTILQL